MEIYVLISVTRTRKEKEKLEPVNTIKVSYSGILLPTNQGGYEMSLLALEQHLEDD